MRRYSVGIIGCGPRAARHAEALRRLPEVDIAGAADLDEARLAVFCDCWEIEGRYASSAQLLESHRLDLATIATLPEPRAELVVECAKAGVPAINAEKVIAYDLASMDAMLEACRRSGSLLTVNHQMRFMPQFLAVRELIRDGRLGEVRSLRAGSRGNLTEQGPHVVDQMLFMNDETPAEWVMGQGDGREGYALKHRAPSTSTAEIRFTNGARGSLISGILAPEVDPAGGFWLQKHIEVTGTKGWAGAYVNTGWRAVLDTGEVLSGPGTWEPNWPAQAALFRAALDWVDDRSLAHPCRGELAARGLEILLAVCRSSLDRAAIVLPLDRDGDPLRELKEKLGPGHAPPS